MPDRPVDDYFRDAPKIRNPRFKDSPTPPVPVPGVTKHGWEGVTMFTAQEPKAIDPILPYIDTLVLKGDGGDKQTISTAAEYAALGKKLACWWSWDDQSSILPGQVIGQAEGEGQRKRCDAYDLKHTITNVTFSDDRWLEYYAVVFTECYLNTNPDGASPLQLEYEARKRGAKVVIPCFGVGKWGEAPIRVPLSTYLAQPGVGDSIAIYYGEYLMQNQDDIDALIKWHNDHKP